MQKFVLFFTQKTETSRLIVALALAAAVALTVYLGAFFYRLNSTLDDASWGDISYYNQVSYNFTHGRPLQSSLYREGGPGVLNNPFAFVHAYSLHVNFTPYLFVWLCKFLPPVNGLYGLTIFFNLAGFLLVGWLIARRFPGDNAGARCALVFALFAATLPFMDIITYKGHFPLFSGPLVLAAYYFCLKRQSIPLFLAGVMLCGVSEDMAMFMCSFCLYLFFFEEEMRRTALWLGLFSALYVLAALFVIQPAVRVGFTIAQSSDSMARLSRMAAGDIDFLTFDPKRFFKGMGGALAILGLLSGLSGKTRWKKPLGLIFIAPASHWFITITQGGGHHLIPIMSCAFIALLLIAQDMSLRPVARWRLCTAPAVFAFAFLPKSAYELVRHFPRYDDPASAAAMRSNGSLLAAVAELPRQAGVCYWTNEGVDAFMSSRSDLWRFPEYFDSADYLVIQKDAVSTFYRPANFAAIDGIVKTHESLSTGSTASIDPEVVKELTHELVKKRALYVVKSEDEHVLVLKRKESAALPCPESTMGMSWIYNIWK